MINRQKFFDSVRQHPFNGSMNQDQVDGMNYLLDTWEKHFERDNPYDGDNWLAYALATAYHETAATMRPIEEYGKGEGKSYGEPTGPHGQCYYGRGHVQLTWEDNYIKAEEQLKYYDVFPALHRYPDQALEDEVSALILYDGMLEGWFTGVGLPDYFDAAQDIYDPYNARRIVNGTDQASLIEGYFYSFKTALV